MSESSAPLLPHLIAGEKYESKNCTQKVNFNPGTGEAVFSVPMDDTDAAEKAVQAASAAFPAWAATPVGDRIQHLFRYKTLLEENIEELAAIVVKEHGKTTGEAIGSVRRGIDCIEHACGAPILMMGRTLPQIAVSSSFCRTEDDEIGRAHV